MLYIVGKRKDLAVGDTSSYLQCTECVPLQTYIVVSDVLSAPQGDTAGSVGCVHEISERGLQPKKALPNGKFPWGRMSPRYQATLCGHGNLKPRCLKLHTLLWQTSSASSPFTKLQWSSWMSWGTTGKTCVTAAWSRDTQAAIGGKKDPYGKAVTVWTLWICIRLLL